ncbi:MAG: HD domain-containing protein [bacterium]|nr:HD domain-containing protein [bacterium]
MKTVAVLELKPGMVLGEDVIFQNNTIYTADTTLDENIILKLKRYSIMCVSIKENIDFATTHYERLIYSDRFRDFEVLYQKTLQDFYKIMQDFINNKIPPSTDILFSMYNQLYDKAQGGANLLDYLFHMVPTEEEMTYSHALSSALLAGTIADWVSMNKEAKEIMILSGYFYDIGKFVLPSELLWKIGKLSEAEQLSLKNHTRVGYQLIQPLEIDQHIKNTVLMHHERIDGTGYPFALKDKQIDVYAKYMSIIDAYIGMASSRTYRSAISPLKISDYFEKNMNLYDAELLLPVMRKIADAQIGTTVVLNDDSMWDVFLINSTTLSRPMLKNSNNEIINLAERNDLSLK